MNRFRLTRDRVHWQSLLHSVTTKMTVYWDVAPSDLVDVYRRFGSAYCLHHKGIEAVNPSETSVSIARLHGAISQESHLYTRSHENLKCDLLKDTYDSIFSCRRYKICSVFGTIMIQDCIFCFSFTLLNVFFFFCKLLTHIQTRCCFHSHYYLLLAVDMCSLFRLRDPAY